MGVSKAVRYRVTYKLTPEQIAAQRAEDDATEAAFNKGFLMRYMNLFPKRIQMPVTVATVTAVSCIVYHFLRPGEATQMKTLSKEWMEATKQYQAAQNQNPILRYKEAKKLAD